MTILEKIVKNRLIDLKKEKNNTPLNELRSQVDALLESGYKPHYFLKNVNYINPFLIAEIKMASPSKGIIRRDFDLSNIARAYDSSLFVNAISILTEPQFFNGRYEYIKDVGNLTSKPILMKDFILDSYQIYKGFLLGASAILLIASILNDNQIDNFIKIANELNMGILFETHTTHEYKRVLNWNVDIIGINNRNLETFTTDINNTIRILQKVGKVDGIVNISESGIKTREDIKKLLDSGVDGFLIGERFMKYRDIKKSINDLFGDEYEKTSC